MILKGRCFANELVQTLEIVIKVCLKKMFKRSIEKVNFTIDPGKVHQNAIFPILAHLKQDVFFCGNHSGSTSLTCSKLVKDK